MRKPFLQIVEAEFSDLSLAETELVRNLGSSDLSVRSSPLAGQPIRASLLLWILKNPSTIEYVGLQGLFVRNALITDELELSFISLAYPVYLLECTFEKQIVLRYANLKLLEMRRSRVKSVDATGIRVEGAANLSGIVAEGRVSFRDAHIGSTFCLDGATLSCVADFRSSGDALLAVNISVGGDVLIRGLTSLGTIDFKGARVTGNFECFDGEIKLSRGVREAQGHPNALWLENARIGGHVLLRDALRVAGCVNLLAAKIGGNLECDGSTFINEGAISLLAERAQVDGSIYLRRGFQAHGLVHLLYAVAGGSFDCSGSVLHHSSGGVALSADGATFGGPVLLTDLSAIGGLRFTGASCRSSLICSGTLRAADEGAALVLSSAKVAGDLMLVNLNVKGLVEIVNARIGSLSISEAKFSGNPVAFAADAIEVENSVQMDANVVFAGSFRMHSGKIGLHFYCSKASFTVENGVAVLLDAVETGGDLSISDSCAIQGGLDIKAATIGATLDLRADLHEATLDLSSTRTNSYLDGPQAWPRPEGLVLDGFTYQRLLDQTSDVENRLRWFHHQKRPSRKDKNGVLRTQPYAQLAKIYREQGNEEGARKTLISLQDDLLQYGQMPWPNRLGRLLLKVTMAYGYKPLRALWFIAAFVLAGYFVFGWAYQLGKMSPTNGNRNGALQMPAEPFCALAYAIDTFVPIIDLGQRANWHPVNEAQPAASPSHSSTICGGPQLPGSLHMPSWFVRGFRWLDIAAGWFFTSLFVAGITGLVRK